MKNDKSKLLNYEINNTNHSLYPQPCTVSNSHSLKAPINVHNISPSWAIPEWFKNI